MWHRSRAGNVGGPAGSNQHRDLQAAGRLLRPTWRWFCTADGSTPNLTEIAATRLTPDTFKTRPARAAPLKCLRALLDCSVHCSVRFRIRASPSLHSCWLARFSPSFVLSCFAFSSSIGPHHRASANHPKGANADQSCADSLISYMKATMRTSAVTEKMHLHG
jgi:hypothetical protein